MIIVDSIYGEFRVEPILEELIQTKAVQRLKRVHQGGASYLINPHWNVTRYEHSIGVMLLIRKLGGSLEEQIVGLLHDVSHTAFSHVVDFALKNTDEDYHELIYKDVIERSEIPKILMAHGYEVEMLYDHSKWTILEQALPHLCADRVDYTIRDMYRYGYVDKSEVLNFLNEVTVVRGEIVLTSLKAAQWFVRTYYQEVIDFFYDPRNIYAYDCLAKALAKSLALGELTLDHFLEDDETVLNLMKQSLSVEVKTLIEAITQDVTFEVNEHDYDLHLKAKVRLIDPTVVMGGSLYKTSELSHEAGLATQHALAQSKRGLYLKIHPALENLK